MSESAWEEMTCLFAPSLADGAFFWIDHHDFVRSTLSEEILATNREQLDAMIDYLQIYRDNMKLSSE
ncbi:hypothetical protein LVT77_14350 [Klebsiella pneumoniae]|nr:hypothetical protein [Klebsiella pneumoniae]